MGEKKMPDLGLDTVHFEDGQYLPKDENITIQIQEDAAPTRHWVAGITNDFNDYVSLGTRGGGQSLKCIFKWPHDLVKLMGKAPIVNLPC
ncbi:hypothetical protein EJ110_NYTH52362 [Nymphaea thermarum]|nr:hypothetical protein EJ110_NYTH52362 [Nymphaea thermarum]